MLARISRAAILRLYFVLTAFAELVQLLVGVHRSAIAFGDLDQRLSQFLELGRTLKA